MKNIRDWSWNTKSLGVFKGLSAPCATDSQSLLRKKKNEQLFFLEQGAELP